LTTESASGKVYVRGYDNQGRAFLYMRPGRENTQDAMGQMKHLVFNLEKAVACTGRQSLQMDSKLEKINLLIDFEGWTLRNSPPLATTQMTLDILQKHYPERMYRSYMLSPPRIFTFFWNMIRPFVDPVSKQKLVFVTTKQARQELVAQMRNLDEMEVFCGGTSTQEFNPAEYLQLPLNQAFGEE